MSKDKTRLTPLEKHKRTKLIIIISFIASVIILIACASAPSLLLGSYTGEDELETVDPSKLSETKEEGFDIFEYQEYLKYDRNIYYYDKLSGVSISLDKVSSEQYGEAILFAYDLIGIIANGEFEKYNSLVGRQEEKYESFTQQQLYDIILTLESSKTQGGAGKTYSEYVVKVEYKIHENNGTYRRDIESDASRAQYYVINDSLGELLLMDIVFTQFKD